MNVIDLWLEEDILGELCHAVFNKFFEVWLRKSGVYIIVEGIVAFMSNSRQ